MTKTYLRFPLNTRNSFYRLTTTLMNEGKKEKAAEVIDFVFKKIPDGSIPFDVYTIQFADPMFKLAKDSTLMITKEGLTMQVKDFDKFAMNMITTMADRSEKTLEYLTKK
jgi:hypothetical protein